jgi:hypothetical protein
MQPRIEISLPRLNATILFEGRNEQVVLHDCDYENIMCELALLLVWNPFAISHYWRMKAEAG